MLAYVSLWSADLLDLGTTVDEIGGLADGLHVDVFDGHNARELLFGPDLVAALRRRTGALLDVHLNVEEPHFWIDRFSAAGADMITVQSGPCDDVADTLGYIRSRGVRPSLGLETHEPTGHAVSLFGAVDRVLLMGTPIGVRGADIDPHTPQRVSDLVAARDGGERPLVVVDGGIRTHTVRGLATAGADGVVPGSLVFGCPDPAAAVHDLHRLTSATPTSAGAPVRRSE
jgi:ribulose-phosphate 3-epimerase